MKDERIFTEAKNNFKNAERNLKKGIQEVKNAGRFFKKMYFFLSNKFKDLSERTYDKINQYGQSKDYKNKKII